MVANQIEVSEFQDDPTESALRRVETLIVRILGASERALADAEPVVPATVARIQEWAKQAWSIVEGMDGEFVATVDDDDDCTESYQVSEPTPAIPSHRRPLRRERGIGSRRPGRLVRAC